MFGLDRTVPISCANVLKRWFRLLPTILAAPLPFPHVAMKLDAFPVDLIESRVEYEVQRRIHPPFRRNFRQNIFPGESLWGKDTQTSQTLLIRITLIRLFSTHRNPQLLVCGVLCASRFDVALAPPACPDGAF
jgi:hypothetical protein